MQRVFRASWDRWVWLITVLFIALMGVLPLGIIAYGLTGTGGNRSASIGLGVLMLVILAIIYLLAPQAYQVEAGALTVQRAGTDVTISLGNVTRVEVTAGWPIFRGALRLGASGGAFGFYGAFWNKTLKNFTAYATRLDTVVILYRAQGSPIVVTPDDADAFAQLVEWARRR